MTEDVCSAYDKSVSQRNFECDYVSFSGNKYELLNNLENDFITPIERGDIFILSDCLSEEMNALYSIFEFSPLFFKDIYELLPKFQKAFLKQVSVCGLFLKNKSYTEILKTSNESLLFCENTEKQIRRLIKNAVCCKDLQPLLKYTVLSCFLDLIRLSERYFSSVCSVIIGN